MPSRGQVTSKSEVPLYYKNIMLTTGACDTGLSEYDWGLGEVSVRYLAGRSRYYVEAHRIHQRQTPLFAGGSSDYCHPIPLFPAAGCHRICIGASPGVKYIMTEFLLNYVQGGKLFRVFFLRATRMCWYLRAILLILRYAVKGPL